MPMPENANSVMLVRPTMTAPAWRSRATISASCSAGCASLSALEPACVISPATSNRSLIDSGMHPSADNLTPAFAGGIVDARQARFGERAAGGLARGKSGRELGERGQGLHIVAGRGGRF